MKSFAHWYTVCHGCHLYLSERALTLSLNDVPTEIVTGKSGTVINCVLSEELSLKELSGFCKW